MIDDRQMEFTNAFQGRRILVTGATGFVGRHLCDALTILGAEIYAVSRTANAGRDGSGIAFEAVDVQDYAALRAMIHRVRPAIVYHLAGLVDTGRDLSLLLPTLRTNLLGSVHLLHALTEIGCERVIVMGSSEELCCAHGGAPNSPYTASKAAGHLYGNLYHRLYQLPLVTARIFMAYGPRQPAQKFIPYTITSLLQRQAPRLKSGNRVCDLIFIDDLVHGLLTTALASGVVGNTIDLGTGSGTSLRDIAEMLVEIIGSAAMPIDAGGDDRPCDAPQLADIRTHHLLGDWHPRWSLRRRPDQHRRVVSSKLSDRVSIRTTKVGKER